MNLVPVLLQAEGLAATLVLLLLIFVVAALVAFVLVGVWLYNDCRQRGENAALWLTLYIVVGIITGIIGAVIVLVIYLVTRSKEIKYDRRGNLVVPGVPPTPMYYGQQPQAGWQPAQQPLGMSGASPPPSTAISSPAPPPSFAASPPPLRPIVPPTLSKVRCPRCRNVFEYQKQPMGQTHVKCPSCGEEGNI